MSQESVMDGLPQLTIIYVLSNESTGIKILVYSLHMYFYF